MSGNFSCVIVEPTFYCFLDEDQMFKWLYQVEGYVDCRGYPAGLRINFNAPFLTNGGLRDLIGLFTRYGIEMKFLRHQLHDGNADWFGDPQKYWHAAIFGGGDPPQ